MKRKIAEKTVLLKNQKIVDEKTNLVLYDNGISKGGNPMKNIWNSPFVQKLSMVTNLVFLNFLWILCSIPVVTAGAATAALYHTVFQYITGQDDAVLRPFFQGFRLNFRQGTVLWLIFLVAGAVLTADAWYLLNIGKYAIAWLLLIILILLGLMLMTHAFPMIARFDMKLGALVKTSLSLSMLHLPATLVMVVLNIMPVVAILMVPNVFLRFLILWGGIWFALVAFLNGRWLMRIWNRHLQKTEEEKVIPNEA